DAADAGGDAFSAAADCVCNVWQGAVSGAARLRALRGGVSGAGAGGDGYLHRVVGRCRMMTISLTPPPNTPAPPAPPMREAPAGAMPIVPVPPVVARTDFGRALRAVIYKEFRQNVLVPIGVLMVIGMTVLIAGLMNSLSGASASNESTINILL